MGVSFTRGYQQRGADREREHTSVLLADGRSRCDMISRAWDFHTAFSVYGFWQQVMTYTICIIQYFVRHFGIRSSTVKCSSVKVHCNFDENLTAEAASVTKCRTLETYTIVAQ